MKKKIPNVYPLKGNGTNVLVPLRQPLYETEKHLPGVKGTEVKWEQKAPGQPVVVTERHYVVNAKGKKVFKK